MGYEHEKSKDCEAEQKLAIGYSGLFLDCLPKKSDIVGYVLTHYGKLFYRAEADQDFKEQNTPECYIFRDLECYEVLKVNTCKKSIKRIKPEGRLLDCTDRMIYEAQCDCYVKVCDLSDTTNLSTVQTLQVECDQTELVFPVLDRVKDAKYLPKLSSDDDFNSVELVGDEFVVNLASGRPPVGQSSVLTYEGQLVKKSKSWKEKCEPKEKKTIIVSVIIERVANVRTSVFGGEIPETAVAPTDDQNTAIDDAGLFLVPAQPRALGTIENWTPPTASVNPNTPLDRYMLPSGSLAANGEYTVPCDGDYDVEATLTYFSADSFLTETSVPYFLLWLRAAASQTEVVLTAAPVSATTVGANSYTLTNLGQGSISTSLSLNAGDVLYLQYLDASTTAEPGFTRNYQLGEVTTNWTIEYVGTQTGTPIA